LNCSVCSLQLRFTILYYFYYYYYYCVVLYIMLPNYDNIRHNKSIVICYAVDEMIIRNKTKSTSRVLCPLFIVNKNTIRLLNNKILLSLVRTHNFQPGRKWFVLNVCGCPYLLSWYWYTHMPKYVCHHDALINENNKKGFFNNWFDISIK